MRILSVHVMKWAEQNSIFLTSSYELGFLSWYQRSFFKDSLNFGARTSVNRSKPGQLTSIHLAEAQAKCYLYIAMDRLAYVVIADDQYPQRVVQVIIRKLRMDFGADFPAEKIETIKADENLKWPRLEENIIKFQDPKEADKLQKLKESLNEVEQIVQKNMGDLLKRGQDLDRLMENSKDLNKISLEFYKTAKKANTRCCSLY